MKKLPQKKTPKTTGKRYARQGGLMQDIKPKAPQPVNHTAELTRPLSKSRFKIACECPTKLFYQGKDEYPDTKQNDDFLKALAEGGHQVGALAKLYFPDGFEITERDYARSLDQTKLSLAKENITLFEAAFRYENLFIRADIVEKKGDILNLYEVKASSFDDEKYDDHFLNSAEDDLHSDWAEYVRDLAFQTHVIQKAYPKLTLVPHLYLFDKKALTTVSGLGNKFQIVREGKRAVRIVVSDSLKKNGMGEKILKAYPASRAVEMVLEGKDSNEWRGKLHFSKWVRNISEAYLNDQKILPVLGNQCKGCEYRIEKADFPGKKSAFDECWKESLALKPSDTERARVFDVWDFRTSEKLMKDDGTYFMDEIKEEDINPKADEKPGISRTTRQWLQVTKYQAKDTSDFFDKEGLLESVKDIDYPLHFIDFETCMPAIPFAIGRHPYEQIAFQFSHHLLHKDGTVVHQGQYINPNPETFPNFDFLRALKSELDKDIGTIFRYSHHENTVLNQIGKQLSRVSKKEVPDKEELIAWIKMITNPKKPANKKTPPEWVPTRPMIDLCELVKRHYYDPYLKNSNSIKKVLPAILRSSKYLNEKYSKPIYGSKTGINSLNFKDKIWVEKNANNEIKDPYELLPPVFEDYSKDEVSRYYSEDELGTGGEATVAYARMQFTEMSTQEREAIVKALLRYCELDTLAMVMIWEAWTAR